MSAAPTLTLARRFNGPPDSANGGYACGRLAAHAAAVGHLAGPAAVTLHLPVPVDTPLDYRPAGRRGHAWHGDELVASVAAAADGDLDAPGFVPEPDAKAAEDAFVGEGHPFPGCFVCGTERPEDGLGLRPGPVAGLPGTVACRWTPDARWADERGEVGAAFVWSALDCPGGWTADPVRRPRVLGRMTARIDRLPTAGRTYVVVGRLDRAEGRTATNTTALYDPVDGTLLAAASAVWVALDGSVA
ncbi:hypothetical protein [Streptomyces collinus]|uniref:hypothetical protein n=1 Tax=Streptomyces collinus TaxID=42684 RepID=UPI00341FB8D3